MRIGFLSKKLLIVFFMVSKSWTFEFFNFIQNSHPCKNGVSVGALENNGDFFLKTSIVNRGKLNFWFKLPKVSIESNWVFLRCGVCCLKEGGLFIIRVAYFGDQRCSLVIIRFLELRIGHFPYFHFFFFKDCDFPRYFNNSNSDKIFIVSVSWYFFLIFWPCVML